MTWYRSLGNFEQIIIALFVLLYVGFIFRTFVVARRLRAKPRMLWLKLVLRFLFLAFVVLSIMGPSFGGIKKEIKAIGKDVFIAIDLSQSMNCNDIQPSRLEKVKYELKKILETMVGDRVGLIIFSSDAYLYCPLTFDKSGLNTLIETLNTNVISSQGTDFGKPLAIATDKFLNLETTSNLVKSRLVLLISDGEDFGGSTEDEVEKCEKNDIRVFTLGVGTVAGGQIPLTNGQFKKNEDGEVVITKLSPKDMKAVSSATKGKYFELTDERNEVPQLISEFEKIEGEVRDVKSVDVGANKYVFFLTAALIFLLLDLIFTVKIVQL